MVGWFVALHSSLEMWGSTIHSGALGRQGRMGAVVVIVPKFRNGQPLTDGGMLSGWCGDHAPKHQFITTGRGATSLKPKALIQIPGKFRS